ncbi:MAG: DUF6580 family putative transport protein, partial [Planctomycetota bacterium]
LFFLVTNLAVWAFRSDYPATLAGLRQSYAAGLPFYQTMLLGDLFYLSVLLGCLSLATNYQIWRLPRRRALAKVVARSPRR